MYDSTEVIAKIPRHEEGEDSESFQELLGYSDGLVSGKAIPRFKRRKNNTMKEVEEEPRFRRLLTVCPYCGNLYSFRTDQPDPATCGMSKCIKRFEEKNRKRPITIKG
jgi:hypothetical protein